MDRYLKEAEVTQGLGIGACELSTSAHRSILQRQRHAAVPMVELYGEDRDLAGLQGASEAEAEADEAFERAQREQDELYAAQLSLGMWLAEQSLRTHTLARNDDGTYWCQLGKLDEPPEVWMERPLVWLVQELAGGRADAINRALAKAREQEDGSICKLDGNDRR